MALFLFLICLRPRYKVPYQQNISYVAMPHPALQRDRRVASMAYLANDLIPSPPLCPFLLPYPYGSPSPRHASDSFPYLSFSDLYLSPLLPSPCCHSLRDPFTSSMTFLTSVMTCRVASVVFLFSLQFQFQSLLSLVYFPNYPSFISFQT